MITEITGDLFQEFESGDVNVIIHQANCFHTMGGGIAKIISQRYPTAKEADDATKRGDKEKLGYFSMTTLDDGRKIINVYSQYDTSAMFNTKDEEKTFVEKQMAKVGRATRYDAIVSAFEKIKNSIENAGVAHKYTLGIPYGYGSDLAGGSWTIVRAIIESIFGESDINVKIVRLPNKPDLK